MKQVTKADALWIAITNQEVETMKGLGISTRTIKVLQKNGVDVNRLYWWHQEGEKAFERNLFLKEGIGRLRTREIITAFERGRSKLRWSGLIPHLAKS